MTRLERFHFLSYFGSGQAIPYFQAIQIGTLYISNPTTKVRYDIHVSGAKTYQQVFQRMFDQALSDGLIQKVNNSRTNSLRLQDVYLIEKEDYDYKITPKGDECLRNEQIERAGDVSFYKQFDRTLDSAKKINPGLF